ncbi:MAG: carboxypeptidase-like regulatory domain-containing protein, partial [Flavobacteriales bacterium]
MFRKIYTSLLLILVLSFSANSQVGGGGSIKGKLKNAQTGEPMPYANVSVYKGGSLVMGDQTDENGQYEVKPLDAGTYKVVVDYVGFQKKVIKGVKVKSDKIRFLNIKIREETKEIEGVKVVAPDEPMIERDGGRSGDVTNQEDLEKLPSRGVGGVTQQAAGVYSPERGGGYSFRGGRTNANVTYLDGIKLRGNPNLPEKAIGQIEVITGGLPAKYGDATGGVTNISTRGPAQEPFGSVEIVTSGFKIGDDVVGLDDYGYSLFEGAYSGPLYTKKDSAGNKVGDPILGFLITGNVTHNEDPTPSAVGWWRIKDDVRKNLKEDPLRPSRSGRGAFYNSDFLRKEDFKKIDTRPNSPSTLVTFAGNIVANTGPNSNFRVGGSFEYDRDERVGFGSIPMNYNNSSLTKSTDWRVYGKFSQNFATGSKNDTSTSVIENAFYSVQVDYARNTSETKDKRHGDELFKYGHIGKFTELKETSYQFKEVNGHTIREQTTVPNDTAIRFEPSKTNEEMASVTKEFFEMAEGNPEWKRSLNQVQTFNGLINGQTPKSIYGVWSNIGSPTNTFAKSEQNQFRMQASGNADIGDHALTIGFVYEQRRDRAFNVNPLPTNNSPGLWRRARILANQHINELNTEEGDTTNFGSYIQVDHERAFSKEDQSAFARNIRKKLGMDPNGNEYVQVDELDPSIFSLDMFSPDELLNDGNSVVGYYGYDHSGDKIDNASLNDFFSEKDENGEFKREIPPFEPIYVAGYIQD